MIERRKFNREDNQNFMLERRRYIRVMESGPVLISRLGKESGEGQILDLSLRGLRMVSEQPFRRGEKLEMSFKLKPDLDMSLVAVIRHSYPWKGETIYGLEFFIRDLSDLREHMKLNAFIMTERARQDKMLRQQIQKEKK